MAVALIGLLLIENLLLLAWYPRYFGWGITLFTERVPAPAALRPRLALNSLERDMAYGPWLPLAFRPLPDGRMAFRESYAPSFAWRYYPVMRGLVEVDPRRQEVRVVGLCNWNVIGIALGMTIMAAIRTDIAVALLLVWGLLLWSFYIQRRRFLEVAAAIRAQLALPDEGLQFRPRPQPAP
jgi:hypothetical protein